MKEPLGAMGAMVEMFAASAFSTPCRRLAYSQVVKTVWDMDTSGLVGFELGNTLRPSGSDLAGTPNASSRWLFNSSGKLLCVAHAAGFDPAKPDDLRALGWAVACHNDYTMTGVSHTFWLFTKDGQAVRGEGKTDAEALDQVRVQIRSPVKLARAVLAAMPAEDRAETFKAFCRHCGAYDPVCRCLDDD